MTSLRRAVIATPIALAGLAGFVGSAAAAPAPDVSVTVTGPSSLTAYEPGTWTTHVTNTGSVNIPVADIVVDNPLFQRLNIAPNRMPANGVLIPGATLDYTQTGRFGAEVCAGDKSAVGFDATVHLTTGATPTPADETATFYSPIKNCLVDIAITKAGDQATYTQGDAVNWTITLTNRGTTWVPMKDITVGDPMIANLVTSDAPGDGWLAPGAVVHYKGSVSSEGHCGTLSNVATASISADYGLADINNSNNLATGLVTITGGTCVTTPPTDTPSTPVTPAVVPAVHTVQCPATTLKVRVRAAARAKAGAVTTVVLTGTNSGSADAKNAMLRYRVPSGAALLRVPSGATLRGGVLQVEVGTLAPGASRTVGLRLALSRSAAKRTHRATMTATCAAGASTLVRTAVTPAPSVVLPAVTG